MNLETLLDRAVRNPPPEEMYERAISEAGSTSDGRLVLITPEGDRGRPRNDTFIVSDTENVDWRRMNPLERRTFEELLDMSIRHLRSRKAYVTDHSVLAGSSAIPVQFATTSAAHVAFAYNMFREPKQGAGFTLLHAPDLQLDPGKYHGRTGLIALDPARRMGLIIGKKYLGLVKKSIFTLANYELPSRGVFPMHAAANMGPGGDVAVFFGLSGTGKTTLSAAAGRQLIGDDEHAWTEKGIENMEGGCYAKLIGLSEESEPHIWRAMQDRRAILENVTLRGGDPDFDDKSLTPNSRGSYPLAALESYAESGMGGHPSTIFFLTADASGVLPPIARLTTEQATYHFLSGYTSKVAGTEAGVTDPEPTFSLGFGEPFLPRTADSYAELFQEKLARHPADIFLINTGWDHEGTRMKLEYTRCMVQAALDDSCAGHRNVLGFEVPTSVPGVPTDVLDPRRAWPHEDAYMRAAADLASAFSENMGHYNIGGRIVEMGQLKV